jgi:hypothetical protein
MDCMSVTNVGEVVREGRAEAVEHLHRQPAGVRLGLQHDGCHRAHENGLGNPAGSVPTDVASHLAAAGGMTDHHGIRDIECFKEFREVIGVSVHVIALPWLVRSSVPATVVRDAAEAVGGWRRGDSLPWWDTGLSF